LESMLLLMAMEKEALPPISQIGGIRAMVRFAVADQHPEFADESLEMFLRLSYIVNTTYFTQFVPHEFRGAPGNRRP